ncbi:reverse transcriptase, partial [Hamiltosporidium tvaerminnensis]
MGIRKYVGSEKQKEKIIKAANRASEVDEVIRECKNDQGIPQPSSYTPSTIINNISIPPSEANTNTKVYLLNTIPSPSKPMHSSTVTPRPDIAASGPNLCTIPISERLVVLRSILRSIEAERQEFIRCVFFAVQTRFDRMPRNGWKEIQSYYNEKFSCTETIDVLKRMAHNKTEEEIRQEENGERRRIATCLAEPLVVRTRKLPNELVDSTVLDLINRIVGEYADSHVPMTITDVARIIQTAQVCYDDETRKERPRSSWKESIESKISVLKLSKDILEKARRREELSSSQTKSLKKIMREFNLDLNKTNDLSKAVVKKNELITIYEKKLTMYESRKQFRKENRMFELFRGRYYRGLSERVESEHVVNRDEIVSFWSKMWNKNNEMVTYDEYLIPFVPDTHQAMFPSLEEFVDIINWLPNWKAAGIDGIYNFYIKKLTTLHKYLYDIVKAICFEGTPQANWFYHGLTYLIPKSVPQKGSDYRPINCMSNLYKLTTKCVTKFVQLEVERRGYLADNQLGAVRGVQGAKEQALLNVAINKEYGNNLKATWIDVKKAYDSIDHAYLTQVIENLNIPDWILKFIKVTISKSKIDISVGSEKIMNKKIDKGILEGDSLSPLLFVLCMDPLSRKLNEEYAKMTIQTEDASQSTNHLLFIDDLKLLAKDGTTLEKMTEEVKMFMKNIGLEINREKSATNDSYYENTATLLEGIGVYKYLGIIEDSRGIPTRKSFEEVQTKLIARVERLCRTRLNARNLFQVINQHAISLINYHIGVLRLEPGDFSKLDDAVRAILIKNKIHLRPGCKERLYLPRTELGRGLHSVEFKSEHMLLQLLDCLEKHKDTSTRRAAILKVENNNKTHLSLIKNFLKIKYGLEEEVTKNKLKEAQLANLYNEIKNRKLHSKLYSAKNNQLVSVNDPSGWLKKGSVRP